MDSGLAPTPMDGGSTADDAGVEVLPEEPDPDRGPDARPSGYVDGGAWGAPPDIAPGDPCCTLAEPIRLTSRDEGMALDAPPVSIAWGADSWALLATRYFVRGGPESDPQQIVYELAPDGTMLGEAHLLGSPSQDPGVIAWAEGRWAVAATTDAIGGDLREWSARLLDRDFRPATEWMPVGPARVFQLSLARLTVGARWEAVRNDGRGSVRATPFSASGSEPEAEIDSRPGSALAAVGMRSRLAVLIARDAPAMSSVAITAAPPSSEVLASVALQASYGSNADIAALRDLVVVAGIEGSEARAELVDPFDARTVGDVVPLGPAYAEYAPRGAIDVIGADELGLAGVCWAGRSGEGSGGGRGGTGWIDFRLVGADGVPRGAAVRVVEGSFRGDEIACSVGTDGAGFVVAWWDGSALLVRRIEVGR